MRTRSWSVAAKPLAIALALTVGACGWVEWPPKSMRYQGPDPATAPPQATPQQQQASVPTESQPTVAPPPAAASRSDTAFVNASAVKVGPGDTVYALSRRHRVSVRAIIEANNLKPPYHLRVGQRVVLPRDRRHVVRKGETLYGIARAYGVDSYVLASANRLQSPYALVVGQDLRIPRSGAGSRPSTSVATAPTGVVTAGPVPPPARPSAVPAPSGGPPSFIWPVKGKVISRFGAKSAGLHNDGINIAAPRGTPVRAAEAGVVAYAGNELRGFGNLLLIRHADGWVTAYAHNEALLVARGDKVRKGQEVARVGSTGGVSRPQLHFELRKGDRAIDPIKRLRSRA